MKRMSDVFVLPVSDVELEYLISHETTGDDDKAIAHALNHVDALADALESIVGEHGAIVLARESVIDAAIAALKAYRGE